MKKYEKPLAEVIELQIEEDISNSGGPLRPGSNGTEPSEWD